MYTNRTVSLSYVHYEYMTWRSIYRMVWITGCRITSWAQMLACTWARQMCFFHAPLVGGRLSTSCLLLSCLKKVISIPWTHIFSPASARTMYTEILYIRQKLGLMVYPLTKANNSPTNVWTWSIYTLKHFLLSFSLMWPVVSHPVRACQLIRAAAFSAPSASYIGCSNTVRRRPAVPLMIAGFWPNSGTRRSARRRISVSCV